MIGDLGVDLVVPGRRHRERRSSVSIAIGCSRWYEGESRRVVSRSPTRTKRSAAADRSPVRAQPSPPARPCSRCRALCRSRSRWSGSGSSCCTWRATRTRSRSCSPSVLTGIALGGYVAAFVMHRWGARLAHLAVIELASSVTVVTSLAMLAKSFTVNGRYGEVLGSVVGQDIRFVTVAGVLTVAPHCVPPRRLLPDRAGPVDRRCRRRRRDRSARRHVLRRQRGGRHRRIDRAPASCSSRCWAVAPR